MNEMLNYVFKSMKTTERALAKLEKTMRRQVRSNRRCLRALGGDRPPGAAGGDRTPER